MKRGTKKKDERKLNGEMMTRWKGTRGKLINGTENCI